MSFPRPSDRPGRRRRRRRPGPGPLRHPLVRGAGVPPGVRARGPRRRAGAAGARLAGDQAPLLAGDPAARRRRVRGDRARTCGRSASPRSAPTASTTPSPTRSTSPRSCEHLGHERVVLVGGDFGGAVIQDLAARFPERTERMVIFNSPLPYVKGQMDGMRHQGDRRPRLLPAPGHRRRRAGRRAGDARAAAALHRHVLLVALLGPSRGVRRRGHRLPRRAVRRPARSARPGAATRPASTSGQARRTGR